MKTFVKKIISLCLCMTAFSSLFAPSYAMGVGDASKDILFFGAISADAHKKNTYTYLLSEYLVGEFDTRTNVIDFADKEVGLKGGYEKLDGENSINPACAFFTFSGNEAEVDLAYAEAIIRKLYEKNDKAIVNFILMPNGDGEAIDELAKYYGAYVHSLREKETLLGKYGKFSYSDLFYGDGTPNDNGHNTIGRIIINDLKSKSWKTSVNYKDSAIYEEIISSFEAENTEDVQMNKLEIYCSPDGDDANSGSLDSPYKTIAKVVEAILEAEDNTDITAYFREGSYYINEGIVLDGESLKNKKVTFSAYNGEKVVFTNAITVDKSLFKKVTDGGILSRLPQESRGKVIELDLDALGVSDEGGFVRHGVWQYTSSALQFIVDNKLQSIARWPNSGLEKISAASGNTITVTTDRLKRWTTATESWLYGYLGNYFADDSIAISKIDVNNKKITVANSPRYAFAADHSWQIINLLEEIDVAGEWFLDHATNILYYFPPEDFANKEVRISAKDDVLFTLNNTKNVSFLGLIFDGTRGIGLNIKECDYTLIDNCEIRNTGRNAVSLTGRNNTVKNSYIHDTGRGGVWITGGGDIATLTPSNNVIEYCRFENVCNYARTYVPAIDLYGVGDRASHNQISSGLGIAIDFKGKKNIIEYNEIFNYLYEGGDIGTIYCGRSWTTVGTEIRYNYIHDCPGAGDVQAIYLDDGMTGVSVYGNVIENLTRGIYLHFGSYNKVVNNVFVDCDTAVVIRNPLGITDQQAVAANKELEAAFDNGTDNKFDKYGFQTKYNEWKTQYLPNAAVWDGLYPHVKNSPYAGLFVPQDNIFERNIFACKIDYNMSDAMVPYQTFTDNYSMTEEEIASFDLETVNEVYGKKIPGFVPVYPEKAGLSQKTELSDIELLEPHNGSSNLQASGITFSWNRVAEAVRYELIVANDKEFFDIVYKSETDRNKNFATLGGLKYGSKTYYWKVVAYGNDGERESDTYSFTTAAQENIDRTKLKDVIKEAQLAYDTSVEGDQPGQNIVGTRNILNKYIFSANRVFKSLSANQKDINKTTETLTAQLKKFDASKNYVTTKIGIDDMLEKQNAWSGLGEIYKFEGGHLRHIANGSIGYTGKKIEKDQILKFRLKLSDVKGSNWISFGVRTQNVEVQPWNTQSYIFLVKEDVIELQKFNSGNSFYLSIDNEYLKNDTEHEIEFGAVTMGDEKSVRVILSVDGNVLFDYIDSEYQVSEAGFFSIYSAGGKAEIMPSQS